MTDAPQNSIPWIGTAWLRDLTEEDFQRAAERIGCDVAAIKAVWEVEAGGRHYLADGSVIRRFEPHHFPSRHWGAIGFSVRQGEEPWRASLRLSNEAMFQRAVAVDMASAIRASSWGAPQIMGFNAEAAGFDAPEDMVRHMAIGAGHQLGAFVQLVEGWGIDTCLRARDWTTFARRYNGSGQVARYAGLMEAAYRKHSGGQRSPLVLRAGDRGEAVSRLQTALHIEVDGVFGPATHDAVVAFQTSQGLAADGIVGAKTWDALAAHAQVAAVPPVEPVTQETHLDAQLKLAEKGIALGGAAVTTVAGLKDVIPAETIGLIVTVGVGALAVAGLLMLVRKMRK